MNEPAAEKPQPADPGLPKRVSLPLLWAAAILVALGASITLLGSPEALALGIVVAAAGGLLLAFLVSAGIAPARTFEYYLSLTNASQPQRRREGVAGLSALADELAAERRHIAAIRVGELVGDPSDDVRWSAANALTKYAPLLAPATAGALVPRVEALTRSLSPGVRQAGAGALAAVAKAAGGRHPTLASQRMGEMLDDADPAVALWVMDAFCILAEGLEADDQERWVRALLEKAGNPASPSNWKAGSTLAKTGASLKRVPWATAALGLVRIAEHSGGEQAELALYHLEGLAEGDRSPMWSEIAGALFRMASSPDRQKSLAALGLLARLAGSLEADAVTSIVDGLAGSAQDGDPAVQGALDFARACLGRHGAVQGREAAAAPGLSVAERVLGAFSSDDPSVRRWARGVWPVAFALLEASSREAVIDRIVALHHDSTFNVRSAASASLIATRRDLSATESTKVAEGLCGVLRSPDGDIQRLATVTIVGLYDWLELPARELCRVALTELAESPDRVVADQAKDSLEALRELPRKRPQSAA